ncbi:transglycosylase family protein, partial [Nesterenkonia halophila]
QDKYTDSNGVLDHAAIQARVDELGAPESVPESSTDSSSGSSSSGSGSSSSHSLSQYTAATQGVVKELASLLGQSPEQTFGNLVSQDKYTDSNGVLDHAAIQARVDELSAPEPEPEPEPEPQPEGDGSAAQSGDSSTPPPSYNPVWDRLAMCESSGDWSIDTGNTFYGGIQFTKQSWEAVGGTGYPHHASKYEQIARGYELWKIQGWGAWPGCQEKLGLSGDPGGVENYTLPGSGSGSGTMEAATSWQLSLSVPLRAEAASSSEKLAQLPRGAAVRQLDTQGSWVQVRYADDGETVVGWVNTDVMS